MASEGAAVEEEGANEEAAKTNKLADDAAQVQQAADAELSEVGGCFWRRGRAKLGEEAWPASGTAGSAVLSGARG